MNYSPPTLGQVPADCERIIIVGAGGFGREVLQWARHAWPEHEHKIAGFLSDDPTRLDGHGPTLPILGSPEDFEPRPSDGLLLAIGIPGVRREVAEQLEARGARFLTLIHPTAIVVDTAGIGAGTVICPYATVSDAVSLGRFVLVNYHASLGHDASVRDFCVLSPYANIAGFAVLEEEVFLGLQTQVGPRVKIGRQSKAEAAAVVMRHLPEKSLVVGQAAIRVPVIEVSSGSSEGRSHADDRT